MNKKTIIIILLALVATATTMTLGTDTVMRLSEPKKGINIINGQKVVMK